LHSALLQQGINSRLLLLDKVENLNIPFTSSYYEFFEQQHQQLSFYKRVKRKLRYWLGLSHENLVNRHKKIADSILSNKKDGVEVFTFPISNYDITEHPAYKDADLIHLHWVSTGFVDYKTFFRKVKKPVVWTLHDMNPFTGGCHFSVNCSEYLRSCNYCPELEGTGYETYAGKMLKYKISSMGAKLNIHIVSPSAWLAQCSKNSTLFSRVPHVVIPYPIDSNIYSYQSKESARLDLGINTNKKIILFSAFDLKNKRKGLSLLLEALKRLKDVSHNVEVMIMGGHGLNLEAEGYTVFNFGFVKDEGKKAMIYRAADLYVLPSLTYPM
jgi:glycosyltransferase involved in cell wall biosynthesis